MPLLSPEDQQTLRKIFNDRLEGDVTIRYFTQRESPLIVPGQECTYCKETRELLEEITALSGRLHLEIRDFVGVAAEAQQLGFSRIPAFVLEGAAKGRVRFFGIPSGYEFASLIEDLIDVSTGRVHLSEQTQAVLAGLDQDVHIQVFVTPTCPYCPRAARLAHQMAVVSERVTADVIEAIEFPDLAQRYRLYGVPKTVINDLVTFEGAVPEGRFIQEIQRAVSGTTGGGPEAPTR